MTDPRQELINTALAMGSNGLNRGTAGNVSIRCSGGFYITPTGMPDADLVPVEGGEPMPAEEPAAEPRPIQF